MSRRWSGAAPITASRYRFASVTLSVKPALRLCRVPGTQIVPAEVAVVPPTWSDFSQSITSRPSRELTRAAVMPAAPAPTTSASTSTVAVPTSPLVSRVPISGLLQCSSNPHSTSSGSVAVQHPPRRETGICSLIVGFSGGADLGSVRGSNDTVLAQGGELLGVHAQPRAEHVVDMLAEQRRRLDHRRCTVETHWPSRHLDLAGRGVVDRLHDAALGERRVVHQLQGVEHRSRRHAGGAEQRHRLFLGVLPGPARNDLVHLRPALAARNLSVVARVTA